MTADTGCRRFQHLARVTIELASPMSIGSGEVDARFDVMLVRDANGLPAIPGTSLAGVLRSAYLQHTADIDGCTWLFGRSAEQMRAVDEQRTAIGTPKAFDASRITTSWAAIHDRNNVPVTGLAIDRTLSDDPLLAIVLTEQPQRREHVRIGHRGAPTHGGKFDRASVPVGYRFTFELALQAEVSTPLAWSTLLSLLSTPAFRLGGSTRRGLGRVSVVSLSSACYDLAKASEFKRYCDINRDLAVPGPADLRKPMLQTMAPSKDASIRMSLRPDDYWRVGQGKEPLANRRAKNPDMLQVTEQTVVWTGNRGALSRRVIVVPGSGIKGALAHRTAFHDRRRRKVWADENRAWREGAPDDQQSPLDSPAVLELFGVAYKEDANTGKAGCVFVDDVVLDVGVPQSHGEIWRNGIDRFSGGVRHGVLFGEEAVFGRPLNLNITVSNADRLSDDAKEAFLDAVEDLATGRLALGAGSSRGQGYFSAEFNREHESKQWPRPAS